MRWLLKRGWMYAAMIAISRLRAVPDLLGRDHVAEAAAEIYTPHAGLVAERPAVGPVPARAGRGPRRPRADELADRRERRRWSICVIVGALAAYALARFRVPLKRDRC